MANASQNPLFEPRESPPARHLVAFSDGGARGNPGPSGYGVVIQNENGEKIAALSEFLGVQTNNVAEYRGLIAALEYTVHEGHKALKVISDSELLVRQMKGIYKVKDFTLKQLHERARQLTAQLDWFSIGHVLRGKNQEADALANAAMDRGTGRSSPPQGAAKSAIRREFEGVVRNGKIELRDGSLPEGSVVQVRVKP